MENVLSLQRIMNPWLTIQQASQVIMILLAFAMLILPILHQPEEAAAADPLTICIIAGCFAIIATITGVCLAHIINDCNNCGQWGAGTSHEKVCVPGCGQNFWSCVLDYGVSEAWLHACCS